MASANTSGMGNLNRWQGVGQQVLRSYLESENGGQNDDDNFGIDVFANQFEDEFVGLPEDATSPLLYSKEAHRAFEQRPWGQEFGNRPKIHELNQPSKAQELGYRGIDWYPDRDNKSEYYRLAGTPTDLRTMLQILRATREIVGKNVNFEEWFKLWEDGFTEFRENRTASLTNFPYDGEKAWRKTETRPRYREWSNSRQRCDLGYRVSQLPVIKRSTAMMRACIYAPPQF
jgi:hypothetical protein